MNLAVSILVFVAKKGPSYLQLDDRALNIFTDDSSYSGPRRGGMGIRFVWVDEQGAEVIHDWSPPGHGGATNNEMELKACVDALGLLARRYAPVDSEPFSKIVIHTDSLYVTEHFSRARFEWPKNQWRTRDGNPVLHAALWKQFVRAADRTGKRVDIEWHKGHSSSNPHNRTADRLAKNSALGSLRTPLAPVKVRRKRTSSIEEPGCVTLTGQRLRIRIITDRYLRTQRINHYKYEVVSRGPLEGLVDRIFRP